MVRRERQKERIAIPDPSETRIVETTAHLLSICKHYVDPKPVENPCRVIVALTGLDAFLSSKQFLHVRFRHVIVLVVVEFAPGPYIDEIIESKPHGWRSSVSQTSTWHRITCLVGF